MDEWIDRSKEGRKQGGREAGERAKVADAADLRVRHKLSQPNPPHCDCDRDCKTITDQRRTRQDAARDLFSGRLRPRQQQTPQTAVGGAWLGVSPERAVASSCCLRCQRQLPVDLTVYCSGRSHLSRLGPAISQDGRPAAYCPLLSRGLARPPILCGCCC